MKTKLKKGQTVELTTNANTIPAGRYKFEGREGEMLLFSIGKQVLFGLAADYWSKYLVPQPGLGGKRTTKEEFLEGYQLLMKDIDSSINCIDPSGFSFCILGKGCQMPAASDPSVECDESGVSWRTLSPVNVIEKEQLS